MELTPQELTVQGSAMATVLFSQLSSALQREATLAGEKAVLEYRCAQLAAEIENLRKPIDPPAPVTPAESGTL